MVFGGSARKYFTLSLCQDKLDKGLNCREAQVMDFSRLHVALFVAFDTCAEGQTFQKFECRVNRVLVLERQTLATKL